MFGENGCSKGSVDHTIHHHESKLVFRYINEVKYSRVCNGTIVPNKA